jgi:hypothetical protein
VSRTSIWISLGAFLVVCVALLNLVAILGPAYVAGTVISPPGSSALASLPSGMRLYVTEVQKDSGLSLGSIYYRFAFKAAVAVGLITVAVVLPLRKSWAWKSLFGLLALSSANFIVLLVVAILRDPSGFSLGWLLHSIGLDSLLVYGTIVLIFGSRSVRTTYGIAGRT